MGYSSGHSPCGCRNTRLLEPAEDIWVEWEVCADHYRGAADDRKILEAVANRRKHLAAMKKVEP